MKIVILYDSRNRNESTLSNQLVEKDKYSADWSKFDINTGEPFYILFDKLKGENADLIISINANAFSFETELGNCSLNMLPSKVLHLIDWDEAVKKIPKHTVLSLSHYVVINKDYESDFRYNNPDISAVIGYGDNREECIEFAMKELWL